MIKYIVPFGLPLVLVLVAGPAAADSKYGSAKWPSRIVKGSLQVRGSGYGTWGDRWHTIDTDVLAYKEAGTSKGPVIVYVKKNKQWRVVQLHFATGRKMNVRRFTSPISIIRAGRYGVLLRVGSRCYDHSWGKLRRTGCSAVSGRFL